jgi:predicted Zn-dependent protease
VFAARRRYADAIELGTRAHKLARNDQPDYALELSHWNLLLGRADAAREVLRSAIEQGSADSFESGGATLFAAVREYWLLLPKEERAAFAETYLRTRPRDGGPAQGVLAAALLHGLAGDAEAARRDLDALLALRMLSNDVRGTSADPRRWVYLLTNGAQLQEWGLHSMAGYLWRRALGEAGAQVRQDEESRNVLAEMRSRLAALEIETASNPQQARERVDEFLRSRPELESAATLAARLLSTQPAASARIFESLCRTDRDGNHWRNLLNAYEAMGDRSATERLLRGLLSEGGAVALGVPLAAPLDEANVVDLTSRLANLLTADGDDPGARRLLERARRKFPRSLPLGVQLARAYEQDGARNQRLSVVPIQLALLDGQPEEAARVWRELLPQDGAGPRLALAMIEEKRGRPQEAIRWLKEIPDAIPSGSRSADPVRISAAASLARLYLAAGEIEPARALAADLLRTGQMERLSAVAAAFAKAGQRQAAREFLMAAVRRARDPQERFQLQRAFLEYCEEPGGFQREIRRLATFAEGNVNLRAVFEEVRYEQARKRGLDSWLEGELRREWNGGKGGPFVGEKLIRLYRQTGREAPLRETVEAFVRRPGVAEPSLYALQETLLKEGRADLAEPIAQRLRRRYPQNELYTLASAQALWQVGRKAEVGLLLDELELTSVFQENVSESIAQKWAALGERARAEAVYRRMAERDPLAVRSPRPHLQLARAELENKNLPAARRWLRAAYRNPAADLEPLADYLVAAGQWEDPHRALAGDMPLSMERRGRLASLLCGRLDAAGKTGAARRLILSHPEWLAAAPELAVRLRERADPAQRQEAASALENAVEQSDPPPPRLLRELAAFYAQWAEDELAPPAAPGAVRGADSALTHLTRAHQLRPEDFSIVRRLAELYLEKKQAARAAEALQAFLAPDALPTEREQARKLLKMKDEG